MDPRTPARSARPAARRDVLKLPTRQRRGLLEVNDLVFQTQVGIDVFFILEVARHDPRPIPESQNPAERGELMRLPDEQLSAQILEVFQDGFADLAEQ
jgi:hypothetical protein